MKMPKNFHVIGKNVLIRAELEANEYEGGIVVPDNCLVHDWVAEVVQTGSKCEKLCKGDSVLYSKEYAVVPFNESQEYRIIKEDKLYAKLVKFDGDDYESILPLFGWVLCKPDSVIRKVGLIHLPDKKQKKIFHAVIKRLGPQANKMFHVEQSVYFDTSVALMCVENDENVCIISMHDIPLMR